MSTIRPDKLPEWASDGDFISEPASGLKETGWPEGVAPGSGVQNWYQEKVYRWIEYMQDVPVKLEANALASLHLVYDTGSSDDLNDAAIDPTTGKIVVVGNAGEISKLRINAAGSDENPGSPTTTEDLYAVAWDSTHSLFIACGEDDTIQTSSGNGTWTSRSDTGAPLNGVAVSDLGVVICVGDSAAIKRSTNGTTYAVETPPIGALAHKAVAWGDLGALGKRFMAIGSTGAIVSAPTTGTGWTTYRSAVGAADVVNLQFHPNWGFVARYNTTVSIITDPFNAAVDYTISLLPGYTQMLVLDSSIIFNAPFGTATAALQVWGENLENVREIPYIGTNLAISRFVSLQGQILALTNDQIWMGGVT